MTDLESYESVEQSSEGLTYSSPRKGGAHKLSSSNPSDLLPASEGVREAKGTWGSVMSGVLFH